MRSSVLFLYKCLFSIKQCRQVKGFTLLELLISLVIAGMVVAGLLYGVVELTSIDRREANLDQVQRDMNRAMEYMTDDLKEAVYVYSNPQQIATQLVGDPAFPDGTGEVPILAFWRIDPIEDSLPDCASAAVVNASAEDECELLKIRQAAYTLVVYAQKANDDNSNWPGQSRIVRYELSRYSDLATLTDKSGYRDPTDPDDPLAAFGNWQSQGIPAGVSSVLVDYVQAPTFPVPITLNRAPLSDACIGYGNDANGNPLYSVVPANATVDLNNTFFACVRDPVLDTGFSGNQDVYLFLRGNVQGVQGGVRSFSDETSLPILETQVLVRGVVNKGFRQ